MHVGEEQVAPGSAATITQSYCVPGTIFSSLLHRRDFPLMRVAFVSLKSNNTPLADEDISGALDRAASALMRHGARSLDVCASGQFTPAEGDHTGA
jgi:hypothetical protein